MWCRVVGDELVADGRMQKGLAEVARHRLSTPGNPQIVDAHYPHHPGGNGPRPPRISPKSDAEVVELRGPTLGWSPPYVVTVDWSDSELHTRQFTIDTLMGRRSGG